MADSKIAIFIPAFNAASTLPKVLDRIPPEIKEKVKQIFIIDNASADNSYLIGVGYREKHGLDKLEVFRNETNRGYGGSQKRAYQYCIDQGFDIVVMLHGDAQYAPEKIPSLLEPLENNEADMVFGSRIAGLPLKGGMPIYKFLGNKFLTGIENFVLGTNYSEFHSGYRVFRCDALAKIPFDLCADDYHFDTDIMIQFHIKKLRIAEMPIPTYYGDEPNFVNVFDYGFKVLQSTFEYWLWKKGWITVEKYDKV
ncbi:MAG: glycosyl transferase [Elusimicrobia bacterium]|nr:MAG: glycosyl transferase [Elusimicrobiota bacterium]